MNKPKIIKSYKEFISYRSVWMGLAIIWVMFFHFETFARQIFYKIFCVGYGGVDVFFFASGIGCYYSLSKNKNVLEFFKRRFLRIFPTYIPFIIIYMIMLAIFGTTLKISEIAGNILFFGSLFGFENQFNWYLCGLWIFYLLTPIAVSFTKKEREKKILLIASFFAVLLLSFCFIGNRNLMVIVSRMPIAYLGILSASIYEDNDEIGTPTIIISIILSVIGLAIVYYNLANHQDMIWTHGVIWYPFILIVPGVCYIASLIARNCSPFSKVCSYVGKNSFTLYLIHIFLFTLVDLLCEYSQFCASYRRYLKFLVIGSSFAFVVFVDILKYIVKKYKKQ